VSRLSKCSIIVFQYFIHLSLALCDIRNWVCRSTDTVPRDRAHFCKETALRFPNILISKKAVFFIEITCRHFLL
jgi:hypothetical protein